MNILMLGNGFDLHHGLPTAYINFIHVINHFHNKYKDSRPNNLEDCLNDSRLLQSDYTIKNSFNKYRELYKEIKLSLEEYQRIMKLKDNYWFKYFTKCCPEPLTWIDFEKEILYVIRCFDEFFKSKKHVSIHGHDYISFKLGSHLIVDNVIANFNFFYVAGNSEALCDDGSIHTAKYIKKQYILETPPLSDFYITNKEKISEALYEQLNELSNGLKLYLTLFVSKLISQTNYIDVADTEDFFNHFDSVISFNYTNTFEALYSSKSCFHIHGSVDKTLILGVNPSNVDELDELDNTFIMFKKYYQRVINKTDLSYNQLKRNLQFIIENRLDSEINSITVFGHSLDKTDEDIITELFQLSDKITIYYYKDSGLQSVVKNLISIYGKKAFSEIRYEKNIDFLPIQPIT